MLRRLLIIVLCLFALPTLAAENGMNVELGRGQMIKLNGNAKSVFIANPEVADIQMLSPTSLMVFGKKLGQTMLAAVGENNETLISQRVTVIQDVDEVEEALKAAIKTPIEVKTVPNGIILSGVVGTAVEAEDARRIAERFIPSDGKIINRLSVTQPNQIMLKVRFAEMSRSVNKAFGINLQSLRVDNFSFGIAQGYDFVDDAGAIILPSDGNSAIIGRFQNGKYDLNGMIDALETEGLTTILAEPSLSATNGETASFLAGGEIPIPVPSDDGNVAITYKPYGVSLAFTPTIVGKDRINLRVKPEVSQVSTANQIRIEGIAVPSFTTRRAETTVDVGSGQSFVIAGLLQNNTNQTTEKFPGLGDLPVLGALFRSQRFLRDESELVIIVTPYVVRPVNGQLASPTDGFDVPSDLNRVLKDKHLNDIPVDPVAKLIRQPVNYTVE